MLENIIDMLGVVIGVLLATLLGNAIANRKIKRMQEWLLSEEFAKEAMDFAGEILKRGVTDTEIQKSLYIVGGYIGQGARAGFGLGGKGRSKFGLGDIFSGIVSKYAGGMMGEGEQSIPQQNQQTNNHPPW